MLNKSLNKLVLIFVSIIIGILGYFVFKSYWIKYVFAHLGGLGVIASLGYWAGVVAVRKGYSTRMAYLLGFIFPVFLGISAVLWVYLRGGSGCGGVVSISASLIVIMGYYLSGVRKTSRK